jgi:hypothetical protein
MTVVGFYRMTAGMDFRTTTGRKLGWIIKLLQEDGGGILE